jgi:hypothetical protein
MPRPKQGYKNRAGVSVPGATDVTSRYMSPEGLYRWYYNNGKQGLPFWAPAAINIGSAVHKMAELDLIGAADREIETMLHSYLSAPNHLEMANNAFRAFRQWREQNRVRVLAQETSLVSERYQYRGTPDLIAIINNTIGGPRQLVERGQSQDDDRYPSLDRAEQGWQRVQASCVR